MDHDNSASRCPKSDYNLACFHSDRYQLLYIRLMSLEQRHQTTANYLTVNRKTESAGTSAVFTPVAPVINCTLLPAPSYTQLDPSRLLRLRRQASQIVAFFRHSRAANTEIGNSHPRFTEDHHLSTTQHCYRCVVPAHGSAW